MSAILAKISLFFAAILGLINPAYIQLGATNLTFDFKTGDNHPIYYYLNVKNIGPQKERFDISSITPWIFVYREGLTTTTSVYLEREGAVNFVLEIHPEAVGDGVHSGEIIVNAVDVYDYSVIGTKKVQVTLAKNAVIPTPTEMLMETPAIFPTLTPQVYPTVTPPAATPTPSAILPKTIKTPKPLLEATPSPTKEPATTLKPTLPKKIDYPESLSLPYEKSKSFLKSLWSFIKNIFD